tara:strand:- start:514 stop:984 length:471 start_codon:yes stop_codon:yes gene_type:complete
LGSFRAIQSALNDTKGEETVNGDDGDQQNNEEAYKRSHVASEEDVEDEKDGFEVPSHDFGDGVTNLFGRDFARNANGDEKAEKVGVRGALFRPGFAKLHQQFLERVWSLSSFLLFFFFQPLLLREPRFFVRARTYLNQQFVVHFHVFGEATRAFVV